MRSIGSAIALAIVFAATTACSAAPAPAANPVVVFETNKGTITVRLFADKAPVSTKNMLDYVDAGFYNGTVFHRVIPGFMIQGGGFTKDLAEKPTRAPIKNEAGNGLSNKRGTVAMARTMVVDSATAQFFINLVDNVRLDHRSNNPNEFGYAVIGEVLSGMEVVDAIAKVERLCPSTGPSSCDAPLPPGMRDVPKEPVTITKAYVKK
jgi:cyclophilin family peptidyl-prolyl cis-trans isomerase